MSKVTSIDRPLGQMIPISKIRLREDLQVRQEISPEVVHEYAQLLNNEVELDPIEVFEEADKEIAKEFPYYVAEGFHRIESHKKAKRDKIAAIVCKGKYVDALIAALKNFHHGAPTTQADKRKAVGLVLATPELRRKSNPWIARQCGCSPTFVQSMREGKVPKERKKRATKSRASSSGGGGTGERTVTVRERQEDRTASEMIQDRLDTLKEWIHTGALDWPAVLALLNQMTKTHRFVGIPKKELSLVFMREQKFIKEIVPNEVLMNNGKLEIHLLPTTELAG